MHHTQPETFLVCSCFSVPATELMLQHRHRKTEVKRIRTKKKGSSSQAQLLLHEVTSSEQHVLDFENSHIFIHGSRHMQKCVVQEGETTKC